MADGDRVLIAGVGGASLGTEIAKSLALAGGYVILGCDVSEHAYGLYDPTFAWTTRLEREDYARGLLEVCAESGATALIPGGEEPLRLIVEAREAFERAGILVAANETRVIELCTDKRRLFMRLAELDLPTPWTVPVSDEADLRDGSIPGYPCIVKPATRSGGSANVSLVSSFQELRERARGVLATQGPVVIQEYLDVGEGEFTVGVLTLPGTDIVRSIALRRLLDTKLSVSASDDTGSISSGYSQGFIDDYDDVRDQAERIASALGSSGPMNIQGRVRNGVLLPFEINPRFSASTYLRALAGCNEIDLFLQHASHGRRPGPGSLRKGLYLRSLTETYVPAGGVA